MDEFNKYSEGIPVMDKCENPRLKKQSKTPNFENKFEEKARSHHKIFEFDKPIHDDFLKAGKVSMTPTADSTK